MTQLAILFFNRIHSKFLVFVLYVAQGTQHTKKRVLGTRCFYSDVLTSHTYNKTCK